MNFFKITSLLVVLLFSGTAFAQQPACTKRSDVVDHLAKKYTEMPVALGLANNGGVVEVLASGAGETWTIIVTMPSGKACMVAAGENWGSLPKVKKIPGILH